MWFVKAFTPTWLLHTGSYESQSQSEWGIYTLFCANVQQSSNVFWVCLPVCVSGRMSSSGWCSWVAEWNEDSSSQAGQREVMSPTGWHHYREIVSSSPTFYLVFLFQQFQLIFIGTAGLLTSSLSCFSCVLFLFLCVCVRYLFCLKPDSGNIWLMQIKFYEKGLCELHMFWWSKEHLCCWSIEVWSFPGRKNMTTGSEALTFVTIPLMGTYKFLWHLFCNDDAIAGVMWHFKRGLFCWIQSYDSRL